MNREALPLIVALLLPIIIVGLIVLYIGGYDITLVLRKIEPIYYIVMIPFAVGLLIMILWYRKPKT
jgi:hypothetical protein